MTLALIDTDRYPIDRLTRRRRAPGATGCARNSLQRVTEVSGARSRLQAILGYTTQSDFFGSRKSSVLHQVPHVAEIEARQPRYPE